MLVYSWHGKVILGLILLESDDHRRVIKFHRVVDSGIRITKLELTISSKRVEIADHDYLTFQDSEKA